MRIFIEDSFDSAHWLPNVPQGHKCGRMHGHTYRIRLEVEGEPDAKFGWVIDYSDIKRAWEHIKILIDHGTLNSLTGLDNPTCEHLAVWIWDCLKLPGLVRIELRETANCGVVYDGPAPQLKVIK